MFDFNAVKNAYEASAKTASDLIDLNNKAFQSYVNFQTTVTNESLNFAYQSVNKTTEIKNPKDFESAVKENQSELQKFAVKNSNEYMKLYKEYVDGVNNILVNSSKAKVAATAK